MFHISEASVADTSTHTAIRFLPEHRAFTLTGQAFSYIFAVDLDDVVLRHLHWGARLGDDDVSLLIYDAPRRIGSNTWSRPRAHTEELVAHGGLRFDECALKVEFSDGVRGLELAYADHEISGNELAVRLCDRHYPLDVVLRYRVYPGALERWMEVVNTGDDAIVLDRSASASWAPPWLATPMATWLPGMYAAETQVTRAPLGVGRLVLESRRGVPGHAAHPWMAVDGGADEEHGEVWSVAVAWSGSWKIVAEHAFDGAVHLTAGRNDFDLRQPLRPGESVVLPATVGVYSDGGYGELTRRWHTHERQHVVPRPRHARPVLYNGWEASFFTVAHDQQTALAKRAADLGAEMFFIDDGWFLRRFDETAGLGDWTADPDKLPGGLAALADEVHARGMAFGVWVEPEAVNPDSDLFRAHPDWIYQWPTRARSLARNTHLLDLGRPAVRSWMFEALDALLRSADIDALKWDINRPMSESGTAGSEPAAIGHVRGLYEVIDRLRAAHPHVMIESCASGGGRADLGMLARTEWAWPSDNTDALERLAIQEGYGFVHSPHTMMCWVTDSPSYLGKRAAPLRFRFHVAMCGILGIGGDLTGWSDEEMAEAAGYVKRYKEIRETVQFGQLYRLASPRRGEFSSLSYVASDGSQVVLFAFAQTVRYCVQTRLVRLRGLQPDAVYENVDTGGRFSAAYLVGHGLRVSLVGDYASELVVLRTVSPT
ncbi:alpha-galactosidase [Micromonospora sp. DR5-3]|uniref:alpha-galactosidase n=1 Tax=unclassified Micromonospora TaxID=2617518 RepID=UPI0021072921|nr:MULTISPECIES: alpha-galactosidase [unclassified Micromonospora]MCW3820500.1 alpha-galactosidase [Micromonospora sp. DR5-3]